MEKAKMHNFVYIDNSNVWIEGKRVSAVRNGMAVDIYDSINNNIIDNNWRIDFGKLFSFVGGENCNIEIAKLYGSKPPENDSLWNAARSKFEVKIFNRTSTGREKEVDTHIVADAIDDLLMANIDAGFKWNECMVTLVGGDRDYMPIIDRLQPRGIFVEVIFWNHASGELKYRCDKFVNLDEHFADITH